MNRVWAAGRGWRCGVVAAGLLTAGAGDDAEQLFEFQLRALPVDEVSWAGSVP